MNGNSFLEKNINRFLKLKIMEEQLELTFPAIYHLGIYESVLKWSGYSVPVTILEETSERIKVRLERDYSSLALVGTELEVRQTELQRVLGVTLAETLTGKDRWASSVWTVDGQYLSMGILGTKEK